MLQSGELTAAIANFLKLFADGYCYVAAIPTYVGGHLAIGWATDNVKLRRASVETIASRYDTGGTSTPPNLGQLGQLPIFGGIGMLVLGLLLTAAPLALLADIRFSRPATMLLAIVAGALAVAGLLAVIARPAVDPVVTVSLGLSALIFGASALILARPGR